ncbi:MAG: tetratricopeptide repeat protein [Candidatus Omnitrophica bacterium]|nr:tetratricopeptide repeat protein [Candidatus Omnitrophota bacterium]
MKTKHIVILTVILCGLVYANTLVNGFVSDDIADIVKNPRMGQLRIFLFSPHNLLNSLIFRIAGTGSPVVYHLVSIALHASVSVLVYFFLRVFFAPRASMLGAALFAVHPIHVEAVTWISGRPYVLLGLFTLGGFLLYHKAMEKWTAKPAQPSGMPLFLCCYIASLALFSYYLYRNYAFYFMFPLLLLSYDLIFNRIKRTWRWLIPYFLVLGLRLFLSRTAITGRVEHVAHQMEGGFVWTNPLFNMVYSFFSHLGLLLWPANLTLYHEPPVITVFWLRVGIVGLIITAGLLVYLYRKAKPLCFALCLFGMFLAPTYSPVTISWLLAERYLYVPSVALTILLAFIYQKYIISSIRLRRAGLVLCTVIIAGYAVRTVARNEDWRTPPRLWRATVAASPQSPRAHNNMGDVYAQEGNYQKSLESFKKAIALKPHYADAYHNVANIHEVTGNREEAIAYYSKAIQLNPRLYQSYQRLALIYNTLGDQQLAVRLWNRGQELQKAVTAAQGKVFAQGAGEE